MKFGSKSPFLVMHDSISLGVSDAGLAEGVSHLFRILSHRCFSQVPPVSPKLGMGRVEGVRNCYGTFKYREIAKNLFFLYLTKILFSLTPPHWISSPGFTTVEGFNFTQNFSRATPLPPWEVRLNNNKHDWVMGWSSNDFPLIFQIFSQESPHSPLV